MTRFLIRYYATFEDCCFLYLVLMSGASIPFRFFSHGCQKWCENSVGCRNMNKHLQSKTTPATLAFIDEEDSSAVKFQSCNIIMCYRWDGSLKQFCPSAVELDVNMFKSANFPSKARLTLTCRCCFSSYVHYIQTLHGGHGLSFTGVCWSNLGAFGCHDIRYSHDQS